MKNLSGPKVARFSSRGSKITEEEKGEKPRGGRKSKVQERGKALIQNRNEIPSDHWKKR